MMMKVLKLMSFHFLDRCNVHKRLNGSVGRSTVPIIHVTAPNGAKRIQTAKQPDSVISP